ncbi:hypothetical protein Pmar_PMAR013095 [Perkinsus marinus ATCC 50983]|uniref:Uncharacterized protein n=1 Tax=Perkinsus marinus (strain ATCC 50983 / TXsc) TaxID=423536 RepID=C5L4W6_PERM5|nr:hypothetical protein Pmar_PMAR013095 [Perkinsus marinus ATCC 50983]EER08186.1 hypothetical protein Pmar_PMAR013095 [Perkinsus marinus ATCC 50983]|eukprot:XP_002776370.1 hypothetical protein Pmar_PMAR013095 [Perkinsus marinus ATCC 50983]
MYTADDQSGSQTPADSRTAAARTLASLIMRTYRGMSSEVDDETLRSILSRHPDLLMRRGSTRGSVSTRCSDTDSASQVGPAGSRSLEATRSKPSRASSGLLAPPTHAIRRRSSTPDTNHIMYASGGSSTTQSAADNVSLTGAAGKAESRYIGAWERKSSAVTLISESSTTVPDGSMRDSVARSAPTVPLLGSPRLDRIVVSPAVVVTDSTQVNADTASECTLTARRGSTLSIVSDGDESAGPPSTVDQSAPFPVADRRGSLFSVDPAEILGMVRTPCFATSPSDAELFKNRTPTIPRHLLTPYSERSRDRQQQPTPRSPGPSPSSVDAVGWNMWSLTKPEATVMLQTLLERFVEADLILAM